MSETPHTRSLSTLYLPDLANGYLRRFQRWFAGRQADASVGALVVSTDVSAEGYTFMLTDTAADSLYISDEYDDADAMAHDIVTVLLEGLPDDSEA